MITLNFYWTVSILLFVFLGAVLSGWVLARGQKSKELSLDKKFIWFCTVCTYTYINTKEESFSICPRCSSYNTRHNENSAKND